MDERTGEIRQAIEETRARVGDEVEALSYKTDVGARLDDYVDEKKEAVASTVRGAKESVTGAVGSVVPTKRRLRSVKDTAERNPMGLVVGGVAVGFVAGLLLPSTRVEEEHIGEMGRVSSRQPETPARRRSNAARTSRSRQWRRSSRKANSTAASLRPS